MKPRPYEIDSDGVTVWVNGEGSLLGRFGRNGIDIHRPIEEQSSSGECLYCTHASTTSADWVTFVAKMKELYSIDVPDHHKPKRFTCS